MQIKVSHAILFAAVFFLIIIGIVAYFEWRNERLLARQQQVQETLTSTYIQLADSLSARSRTVAVQPPTIIDRVFNTQANQDYKNFEKLIPQIIAQEIEKYGLKKDVQNVNESTIVLTGDSVLFPTEKGVVTKLGYVKPFTRDLSIFKINPQKIKITSVTAKPENSKNSSMRVFISAYNETTGDSLQVSESVNYALNQKNRFKVGFKPFFELGYDFTQVDAGFDVKNGFAVVGATVLRKETPQFNLNFISPKVVLSKNPMVGVTLVKIEKK